MPRSILSSATSTATVPKRYTVRLPQCDWDRLKKVEAAAKAQRMSIDIDGALADFLRREIARSEKKLASDDPASALANPDQTEASSSSPDPTL